MTKMSKDTYTRDYRGNWYKNGVFCRNAPPKKVLKAALNMSIECIVRV